jgi:hypothetical protein
MLCPVQVTLKVWRDFDGRQAESLVYRVYLLPDGLPDNVLSAARSKGEGVWIDHTGNWNLLLRLTGAYLP